MARIKKPGLNYFPLDVDFMNDRKIRKIMREHGAITASAIIAIYSSIYKDKGYYLQWDDDICFDISEVVMVKTDVLKGIVTACVDLEIFNKSLFDEYRILTSEAIQSQYRLCTQRRKINEMDERFILIPIEAAVEDGTHERGSGVQESGSAGDGVGNLPLNANQSTQRKGKEKKEKKTSSLPFSENEEGNEGKEQDGMKKNSVPDYCLNPATHNYRGLLERLQIIGVNDQKEIDTILRLSDYGRIGERVWKLIAVGNWPRGNIIKLPGRYLISQLRKN